MSTPSDTNSAPKISPVYFMLVTVAALWGANAVMIKYLTNFFDPTALSALRLLAATLLLVPMVLWRYGWVKLSWREWGTIAGVGICNIILHQLALSWGLQQTSGTHGVLILALNPLFTMLLAAKFANEPLTLCKGIGIVLGLSGVTLVITQSSSSTTSSLWGDFLIFLSMIVYVIGSLFVKKSTATVDPLVVTAYSHIVGSFGLLVIAIFTTPEWTKAPFLLPIPIAVFLCSALLATALGAMWWNKGIQQVGASTAAQFLNINPIIGFITSAIFLSEALHWQHFLSLLLVLTGVAVGSGLLQRKNLSEQTAR